MTTDFAALRSVAIGTNRLLGEHFRSVRILEPERTCPRHRPEFPKMVDTDRFESSLLVSQ
jgi:hypothetical protein